MCSADSVSPGFEGIGSNIWNLNSCANQLRPRAISMASFSTRLNASFLPASNPQPERLEMSVTLRLSAQTLATFVLQVVFQVTTLSTTRRSTSKVPIHPIRTSINSVTMQPFCSLKQAPRNSTIFGCRKVLEYEYAIIVIRSCSHTEEA